MSTITSTSLGNGNGAYNTDIVVKDMDLTVSNYVKDRTPVTNMAMSKKRKINSTLHIWPNDYFRQPGLNAKLDAHLLIQQLLLLTHVLTWVTIHRFSQL